MAVPVYRARFGTRQAERLLWRAGFGPSPGEARKLARGGLKRAVYSLTRVKRKKARLRGPKPRTDDGLPLAPTDAWGHDHLWWLDRMVRSNQPLVERMALVWHDWFATGDVGQGALNLDQNRLFRRRGLGSFDSFERLGRQHEKGRDRGLKEAGRVARQASTLRRQLQPFSDEISSPVPYPDDGHFPASLAGLAAMLDHGLPIRCATLTAPGAFDTHDNQEGEFRRGLRETCDAVLAFQRDLEARGLDDRVVTLLWSEFGRRPEENGSAGTDHGAGGCGFLVGKRAHGKMIGEWPGLARLDADDNLRATVDFRAIYSSILEQWFDRDAAAVIPGAAGFNRPKLIG